MTRKRLDEALARVSERRPDLSSFGIKELFSENGEDSSYDEEYERSQLNFYNFDSQNGSSE